MTEARGFCTCHRDFPNHPHLRPAPGASWHYACDKPVLAWVLMHPAKAEAAGVTVPTGTGWPVAK